MTDARDGSSSSRAKVSGRLVVIVGVVVVVLGIASILAAFGVFGRARYLRASKVAEGRIHVVTLARGIIACSDSALPPTTAAVPATMEQVSGRTYASGLADWSEPGFVCGKFAVRGPQYFQYRWERVSTTRGLARAWGDLYGDGVELHISAAVTCDAAPVFKCAMGPVEESVEARAVAP